MIEKESKFRIDDISQILPKLHKIAEFKNVSFIRDTIWGDGDKKKIRLRESSNFTCSFFEAMFKYKIDSTRGIKSVVEEIIYSGPTRLDAVEAIEKLWKF